MMHYKIFNVKEIRINYNIAALIILLVSNILFAQFNSGLVSADIENKNIEVIKGSDFKTTLKVEIKNGWHINSIKPNDEFLIPSNVTVKGNGIKIKEVKYPEAHILNLEFSEKPVSVYEGKEEIQLTVAVEENAAVGKQIVEITFEYQACDDKTCMPPDDISVEIEVKVIDPVKKEEVAIPVKRIEKEKPIETEKPAPKIELNQNSVLQETTVVLDTLLIPKTEKADAEFPGILIALLFAFIGGLILNLMPCVLPVLSLKIMGIVEQAGEAPKEKLKHGLLFTFGVLVSFWALAGLLLVLRAGGEQLGWGFQLQSPGFVIVLSIFLFLFGLSMFGVFEIGATLTAVGQGSKSNSGYIGSFTSGILATVVATPCTAPFMGSALGFALSQPTYISLLIFTFLGLGMALPYLILTTTPKLLRFIPKPGIWMETMKQFMGFLLIATVLWLVWVLGLQTGFEGVMILLASLILVSIAGWIYGRWGNIAMSKPTRIVAQTMSILILIITLIFSLTNIEIKAAGVDDTYKQGTIEWQKFSPELVEKLRSEGKNVFLDFTAAWCLSCQVNEKIAFGSEEVQKAFMEKEIIALKADWTNSDPIITAALAEFGRNSVPLYVLYSKNKKPDILPEILTPGIVLDALAKLD